MQLRCAAAANRVAAHRPTVCAGIAQQQSNSLHCLQCCLAHPPGVEAAPKPGVVPNSGLLDVFCIAGAAGAPKAGVLLKENAGACSAPGQRGMHVSCCVTSQSVNPVPARSNSKQAAAKQLG